MSAVIGRFQDFLWQAPPVGLAVIRGNITRITITASLMSRAQDIAVPPVNTRHPSSGVPVLVQRRRRWTNIGTTFCGCPVFCGTTSMIDAGVLAHINPYNAEIFLYKPRFFIQFEINIDVSVSSFCFI